MTILGPRYVPINLNNFEAVIVEEGFYFKRSANEVYDESLSNGFFNLFVQISLLASLVLLFGNFFRFILN